MDLRGSFDLPVNSLPIKCPRCTFPDLDFVPQPYFLTKGISDPNETAEAEVGNFFVRERARRIFELVAPGACRFFPTQHLKTKAATPWFLAVPVTLVRTATVKRSVPRCPDCGEPKVAHPGSHYLYPAIAPVTQDVYKSLNWSSSDETGEESPWYSMNVLGRKETKPMPPHRWTRIVLARELYFSARLEALLKKTGTKGLFLTFDEEKPNDEDLAWVEEKYRLLSEQGLARRSAAQRSPASTQWFRKYLKKHALPEMIAIDWGALEAKYGIALPRSYKVFASTVGTMTFQDVDQEEGFTVRILPPTRLDARRYRKGKIELFDEENEVDGLLFAATGTGMAFASTWQQMAQTTPCTTMTTTSVRS